MRDDLPTKTAHSLVGIEALRAAAAMAVVAYHAAEMPGLRLGGKATSVLQNGAAGVDIFFVVSGFVMVISARRLRGRGDAARRFVAARVRRIVPLYWLCTGVKILAVAAAPLAVARPAISVWFCAGSLLFLPVHDAAGQFKPVLPVGWTLSFEALFYGLFAAALALRQPPAVWVPPLLAVLAAVLPQLGGPVAELGNPIILEFAFGIGLAVLWMRGWRLPGSAAWTVLGVAVALLVGVPKLALGSRVLSWGLPAAALLAAVVSLEARLAPLFAKPVLGLGGASYAIYLTHGFVLAGLGAALAHAPQGARWGVAVLPAALAASAAFGWLVHVTIERKLMQLTGALTVQPTRAVPEPGGAHVMVLAGGGLSPLSGGVGTLMRNLMEAWAKTPDPPQIRMVDTRGSGGRVMGVVCFVRSLGVVGYLCAARRVSLVHAHMTTRGSAARKAMLCGLAMAMRVPVIVHMHGADFIPFHRRLHPLLRWPLNAVLRRAQHVVVLGRSWGSFLVEEAGVDTSRISVVPNGAPCPCAPADRAHAQPHLLFLGRLCGRKGVPELISALGAPCLRALDWHATFAGDGNPAPYRAMLSWHGLQDKVSLPGWLGRAETAALLARADILVLPSHHEAMPVAVIEALAAGVAVVTTPVGAIPEFLQNNVSALLVTPGAPGELTEALLRLLNDPVLRSDIAAAGHGVFLERLDIARIAIRIAELYREATTGGAGRKARSSAPSPPALGPVALWRRARWGLEAPDPHFFGKHSLRGRAAKPRA
jgi:peptidoglycan/LPS O-acetylase OafA/YrhL/glycosyltransferase involved in cell wall biosynthesis